VFVTGAVVLTVVIEVVGFAVGVVLVEVALPVWGVSAAPVVASDETVTFPKLLLVLPLVSSLPFL
jgi:hypothetical protein